MKKWLLLLPVVVAIPALLFRSEVICGCTNDGETIAHYIGVNPMDATPEISRKAFMSKFPIGSPEIKVLDDLSRGMNSPEKHCTPAQTFVGHRCVFVVKEISFFGKRREGFQFDIALDSQRRIVDVSFAKYRIDL